MQAPQVFALITDDVKRAGARLLAAIEASCQAQGFDRNEAEGRISLLLAQLGEELEWRAGLAD